MPGAKEAEMQALPDTPLSWTMASQGGPRIPARGRWVLWTTVFTLAGCRLPAQRAMSS